MSGTPDGGGGHRGDADEERLVTLVAALSAATERIGTLERDLATTSASLAAKNAECARLRVDSARALAELDRLWRLKTVTASQLNLADTSTTSKEKLAYERASAAAVLASFVKSREEDAICEAVWRQVQAFAPEAPAVGADEVSVVHPFMHRILNVVINVAAAHPRACTCSIVLHEYDTVSRDGRADWLVIPPHDAAQCAANKLAWVEGKKREPAGRDTAIAPLRREGIAQVVNRAARRHDELGGATTNAFGSVVDGSEIVFIRIDFASVGFPCYISHPESLVVVQDGEACPNGLRLLVRLLLEQDAAQFGLPAPAAFVPAGPYRTERLLGDGAYGTVMEVFDSARRAYALKYTRHAMLGDGELTNERTVLRALAAADVPRVPRVVMDVVCATTRRRGLLLDPMGVSLRNYLNHVADDVERPRVVRTMLAHVAGTLQSAHAAGVLHGDVCVDNMVVCGGAEAGTHAVYLVGWGQGGDVGARRQRKEMHGSRPFMADAKLRLSLQKPSTTWTPEPAHDLASLLYTFAALCAQPTTAQPPWYAAYLGPTAVEELISSRRGWMVDHVARDELPESLRPTYDAITAAPVPAAAGGGGAAAGGGGAAAAAAAAAVAAAAAAAAAAPAAVAAAVVAPLAAARAATRSASPRGRRRATLLE